MESSNCDPYPQIKHGPHWSTQFPTNRTDQLPVQDDRAHDQYQIHLVSWKKCILDRSQCGFRKHRSAMDHLVSLERYVRDAFARKQHAVGLFFDLEKAYGTTWQYGIIQDLYGIGLRSQLPLFVVEYLRHRRIRVRIGTTLSDEFYPEESVPTGGILAVVYFGLQINELPSCISSEHSLLTNWQYAFVAAPWTP